MVRIGQIPTVIISHPSILQEAFNKPELSGRWVSRTFDLLTDRQSITTTDYGERWRGISELLQGQLSCPEGFAAIHDRQVVPAVQRMVAMLAEESDEAGPVDVTKIIDECSWDMTFATMFGSDPTDPLDYHLLKKRTKQDMQWTVRASTQLSLGDLVPALRIIPDRYVSRARRQKALRQDCLRRLFDIVRNRPSFGQANPSCIMDFMLKPSNALSQQTIETTCTDMMLASNPVASILKWWLVILANRPYVQNAIHEEMRSRPEPADLTARPSRLPYVASSLDECMRYRTVTPLAVPHRATEDTKLAGFRIRGGVADSRQYPRHSPRRTVLGPARYVPT